jgi:aminoglycoside phosphotransferase (APT) family kinase protein
VSEQTEASNTVRGIDTGPVSAWLAEHVEGAVAPFDFSLITGGHSNLTYLVVGADGRRFVLRRPPLGAVLATAHDMGREHRIISGVGRTAVPVPRALGLCEDEAVNGAPFYIMSHVEGVVLHDAEVASEAFPASEGRAALGDSVVRVLADLHTVDPDTVGLGELGRREAYLDRQLKRWRTQWENSKTRELPAMEETYELLVSAKPEQRYTGIVHGDYRLGNMLVDPGANTVAAVLDWELCTLGDVLADVGYVLNNWAQPDDEQLVQGAAQYPTVIGGFPTREQVVERYCELTGFEVTNVEYYRSFQSWRLAAIVEGVLARYLKGVMGDAGDTDRFRAQVDALAHQALTLVRTVD